MASSEVNFDTETVEERLRELAFLNRGVEITLVDERKTMAEVRRTKMLFSADDGVSETEETENEIRIQTEVFTLTYLKNEEKGFSERNLSVSFSGGEWRFGMKNEKNLGGALTTLDGIQGFVPTNDGILSRNGWFALDDSRNAVIENGWLKKSLRKRVVLIRMFNSI